MFLSWLGIKLNLQTSTVYTVDSNTEYEYYAAKENAKI